jgi:hypothetical protein
MNDATTKSLSASGLVDQLVDAALLQYKSDPREAVRQVILFLTEALVYLISSSAGDEGARAAMLKSVGDTIATAPRPTPK